jgi:hypothetical protein
VALVAPPRRDAHSSASSRRGDDAPCGDQPGLWATWIGPLIESDEPNRCRHPALTSEHLVTARPRHRAQRGKSLNARMPTFRNGLGRPMKRTERSRTPGRSAGFPPIGARSAGISPSGPNSAALRCVAVSTCGPAALAPLLTTPSLVFDQRVLLRFNVSAGNRASAIAVGSGAQ